MNNTTELDKVKEVAKMLLHLEIRETELSPMIAVSYTHLDVYKRQQEDWIRRLLEYTELSEEEMKKQIAAEKSKAEFVSRMNELGMILERFGVL